MANFSVYVTIIIQLENTLHSAQDYTPQPHHLVLNTICSSIQRIQPNTPEDGHIDVRNI
jgi:hypothetical protein